MDIRLVDLDIFKRYSLAVRMESVPVEELLAAVEATRAQLLEAQGTSARPGTPAPARRPTAPTPAAATTRPPPKPRATVANPRFDATPLDTGEVPEVKRPRPVAGDALRESAERVRQRRDEIDDATPAPQPRPRWPQ